VLYLHGAGARGDNNAALVRSTARFFAKSARTNPGEWNAFVVAPQCASGFRWVEWNWGSGPYNQTDTPGNTYGEYMHLAENLLHYLTDNANNGPLFSVLGLEADDIDLSRIYVVGDSMGAYGTWDIVARQPGFFAGAISSGGSGPKNRLDELRLTPFWAIHGEGDTTVPNYLPSAGDPDGAGSLGMLGLLDPSFDGVSSTDIIYVDNPLTSADDPPETWMDFIYSEFPNAGHAPAADWTTRPTYGVREWLFAQALTPATCTGDLSGDGDTDGEDLAMLISDFDPARLADFAADFGSFCP
jgi:predicted esterase